MNNTKYKYFIKGPIASEMISELVKDNQSNHESGAQSIFLGQVRADKINNSRVLSIDYSAYTEMAEKEIETIKENAFHKYGLSNVKILHSIGEVKSGEISVLVLVSSAHSEECFDSLKYIIREIKTKVPIWKKEICSDGSHRWPE